MPIKNIFNGVQLEEKEDPRNYTVSQFVPNKDIITDSQFMLKFPTKQVILDQGQWNACVGYSFMLAKSILEYQQTNKWIDFDPFMFYGTRYSGDHIGTGMVPQQAVKILYKEGAFLKRDFGIQEEMPKIMRTVADWKRANPDKVIKAKDYTISGYASATNDYSIKKALKAGMPVSCCYPIYDSFYETGNDGKVPVPNVSRESLEGYHQMLIVGWTDKYWIVANSWGTNYGLKGMYLIPFENKRSSAISVSDTITPSLRKANEIILTIGSLKYTVDGKEMTLDSAPYIKNDRTYLPIRYITESLGCSVEWNAKTQKALIRSEEADIELMIDKPIIKVNGSSYSMDVAPEIVNDRTMVPIRFISEYMNCSVTWNQEKQQVIIKAL